jgi:hypothetical protein
MKKIGSLLLIIVIINVHCKQRIGSIEKQINFSKPKVSDLIKNFIDTLSSVDDHMASGKGYFVLEYALFDEYEQFLVSPSYIPTEDYYRIYGAPVYYGKFYNRLFTIHFLNQSSSDFINQLVSQSSKQQKRRFEKGLEKYLFPKQKLLTDQKDFRPYSIVFVDNSTLQIRVYKDGRVESQMVGY